MYLLAILLPPVAVFMSGKPIQGIINIVLTALGVLTLFLIVLAIGHALFVVHSAKSDKKHSELVGALRETNHPKG